jgi:plasmid stability protein
MSRQLTIRGVPDDVADRLERLSRVRGRSINATVNEILQESLGENPRRRRLQRYVTWSEDEAAAIDAAIAAQRTIDDDLWG